MMMSLLDVQVQTTIMSSAGSVPTLLRLLLQQRTFLFADNQGRSAPQDGHNSLDDDILRKSFLPASKHSAHLHVDTCQRDPVHAEAVLHALRGTATAAGGSEQVLGLALTAVAAQDQRILGMPQDLQPEARADRPTKPGPEQQARSAWLVDQYESRLGAAAHFAAAALRSCQQPTPGLALYAEPLVKVAMGAEGGLVGGPSIVDCAANLLRRMQPGSEP